MDPWSNLMPCCDADLITEGPWSPVFDSLTVNKQKSGESTTSESSMYEWEKLDRPQSQHILSKPAMASPSSRGNRRRSILGDTEIQPSSDVVPKSPVAREAFGEEPQGNPPSPPYGPPTLQAMMEFNAYDGGILPLPSFDYDHIRNGQNDMLSSNEESVLRSSKGKLPPKAGSRQAHLASTTGGANRRPKNPVFPTISELAEEKKDESQARYGDVQSVQQPFYHGIPIFLASLSQIRVRKVSSHPLGAHVLLISEEAMLFSYGLNNHGQLGIGVRSNLKDENRGFHTTPTLITPLLENGGKALHCAAGVDHSLVVVVTEGRRIERLQTNPGVTYSDHGAPIEAITDGSNENGVADDQDSVQHHQLYGFGNNDFMKIGLVRARLADDGSEGDGEDILLPRRVALHCTVWPQQGDTEEGGTLPPQGIFDISASTEHSSALVRRATGDIEVYMWGNATLGALGLAVAQDPEIEIQGGLTQRPTSNANNIFPLPTVLEALTFRPNLDSPLGFPRQISLGPHCSFVVMSTGKCLSFGFSAEGMLGHGYALTHTMEAKEIRFPPEVDGQNGIVAVKAGAYHVIALTGQGEAYSWGINSDDRLGHGTSDFVKSVSDPDANLSTKENLVVIEWIPQKINLSSSSTGKRSGDAIFCVDACAGYDSSMLVTRSGEVYSFGKRSGRLGKGEVSQDVSKPEPLHGGLRLFHNSKAAGTLVGDGTKPALKRIFSDGLFSHTS
jgi:alpha-tubulin suppressor-like RCC1 family protein